MNADQLAAAAMQHLPAGDQLAMLRWVDKSDLPAYVPDDPTVFAKLIRKAPAAVVAHIASRATTAPQLDLLLADKRVTVRTQLAGNRHLNAEQQLDLFARALQAGQAEPVSVLLSRGQPWERVADQLIQAPGHVLDGFDESLWRKIFHAATIDQAAALLRGRGMVMTICKSMIASRDDEDLTPIVTAAIDRGRGGLAAAELTAACFAAKGLGVSDVGLFISAADRFGALLIRELAACEVSDEFIDELARCAPPLLPMVSRAVMSDSSFQRLLSTGDGNVIAQLGHNTRRDCWRLEQLLLAAGTNPLNQMVAGQMTVEEIETLLDSGEPLAGSHLAVKLAGRASTLPGPLAVRLLLAAREWSPVQAWLPFADSELAEQVIACEDGWKAGHVDLSAARREHDLYRIAIQVWNTRQLAWAETWLLSRSVSWLADISPALPGSLLARHLTGNAQWQLVVSLWPSWQGTFAELIAVAQRVT